MFLQQDKGFTLIELLVALALLVVLSGALYGTFFSVMKARDKGGERMEERRELSSTLSLLRNEIASIYYSPTSKYGTGGPCEFRVLDRDTYGKPASVLQFTTLAPPRVDAAPGSDLMVVRYMVKEKENAEGVVELTREGKDRYLMALKSSPYPVLDNLESFLVECYDGNKWVKTWDTDLMRRLPDSVRVTTTVKGGESYSVVATPGMVRKDVTGGFPSLQTILGPGFNLDNLNLPNLKLPTGVQP